MARSLVGKTRARLREQWRRIPLARQVFLAMFCSMFVSTSTYFVFDIVATDRRLLAMERSTMEAIFPVIQGLIQNAMLSGDRGHVRDLFLRADGDPGAERLFLLDAGKRAVDVAALGAGRAPGRRPAPEFDRATFMVMDFPLDAQPACMRCHGRSSGRLGYVRMVSEHQEKVRAVEAHVRTHLAILALTMLLMAVWALWIVRRMIQAPLKRIVAAMGEVSRGRLDTRVEDLPQGELRAIGTGFNAMVSRLDEDRRQIVDLHRRQVAHMERLAALGELSAQLAHEVRNPLTGIGSAIQVLRQETPAQSPRRDVLGKILGQLDRMDKTMSNFLGFARIPEAVERPFDLGEPLGRVIFLVEPKLRAQGIELRRRCPERFPIVHGDPAQLEQVFLNVCLNAIQAMPQGGALTVAGRSEPGGDVVLEFADTGHGIPSDKLDLVFKPFFTTREKGSGLGLSISRQIVMAHNGDMWIESIPDKGASVYVRLPSCQPRS